MLHNPQSSMCHKNTVPDIADFLRSSLVIVVEITPRPLPPTREKHVGHNIVYRDLGIIDYSAFVQVSTSQCASYKF